MSGDVENTPILTSLRSIRNSNVLKIAPQRRVMSTPAITVSQPDGTTNKLLPESKADHLTRTLFINSFVHWKTFPILVERTKSRLDINKQLEGTLTEKTANILQLNGIKVYHKGSNINEVVGDLDSVLFRKTSNFQDKVLLAGHKYSTLELCDNFQSLQFDLNSQLSGEQTISDSSERYVRVCSRGSIVTSQAETPELIAIERLLHLLVLNGLSWGFIEGPTSLRLVKLVPFKDGVEVVLTSKIPITNGVISLLAAAMESFNGRSKLKTTPMVTCFPISIRSPSVMPLSSYGTVLNGSVKWWEARKSSTSTYQIRMNNFIQPGPQVTNGWLFKDGVISETKTVSRGETAVNSMQPATFIIAPIKDKSFELSASVIGYLNDSGVQSVPKLIAYARVQNYQLIAFEECIRPIKTSELDKLKMHEILTSVHNAGIMVNKMNINSIARNPLSNDLNDIRICMFPEAKLVRNVPAIVREREHQMLNNLFSGI